MIQSQMKKRIIYGAVFILLVCALWYWLLPEKLQPRTESGIHAQLH